MGRNIPAGWLDYKPMGIQIHDTRFIAFKVPLKEKFLQNVHANNKMTIEKLSHIVPKLGLVIDLTSTNRYYDPKGIKNLNIDYKKLMIPGAVTPKECYVKRFHKIVTDFLEKNKDNEDLIGVHCTHGINRTGYLICRFMIDYYKILPEIALKKFTEARGHGIRRENYISKLMMCGVSLKTGTVEVIGPSLHTRADIYIRQTAAVPDKCATPSKGKYSIALDEQGRTEHEAFYLPRRYNNRGRDFQLGKKRSAADKKPEHDTLDQSYDLDDNYYSPQTQRGKMNPLTDDIFLPRDCNKSSYNEHQHKYRWTKPEVYDAKQDSILERNNWKNERVANESISPATTPSLTSQSPSPTSWRKGPRPHLLPTPNYPPSCYFASGQNAPFFYTGGAPYVQGYNNDRTWYGNSASNERWNSPQNSKPIENWRIRDEYQNQTNSNSPYGSHHYNSGSTWRNQSNSERSGRDSHFRGYNSYRSRNSDCDYKRKNFNYSEHSWHGN